MLARVRPVIVRARQEERPRTTILQERTRLSIRVGGDERVRFSDHAAKVLRRVFDAMGASEAKVGCVFRRERTPPELFETGP